MLSDGGEKVYRISIVLAEAFTCLLSVINTDTCMNHNMRSEMKKKPRLVEESEVNRK